MRWAQRTGTWGNPKWHWVDPDIKEQTSYDRTMRWYKAVCGEVLYLPSVRLLPGDRRPAMARNNVCSHCKKAYIAFRPDLKAAFDKLNDKRDV